MQDFLSRLDDHVLVCDGAMGTMLYSKGVFISRCFDELNISNPQLVREVHLAREGVDYVEGKIGHRALTPTFIHRLITRARDERRERARWLAALRIRQSTLLGRQPAVPV